MKKTLLLLFILITGQNIYAQFPYGGPQSKVVTDSIFSNNLDAYRGYNIFLPKSYDVDTDKKYPVLYLLHGMGGNHLNWENDGHVKDVMDQLVASGEACEMIIVMPNAGGNVAEGHWNGYFNMPGWNYEDFFYKEFMPYIESNYRIIGDKKHRGIAGLSMGGGGATSYAQKYSDKYNAVYAMSALMSIPQGNMVVSDNPEDKFAILTKSVIDNSCIDYIINADENEKNNLRSVSWMVDCGDDDFLLDRNIEFIQAMHSAQIPCEFSVRDGGHTMEYWRESLYKCLPYMTRNFSSVVY